MFWRFSSGIESIPEGAVTLVTCRNGECNANYEMPKREYHTQMEQKQLENPELVLVALPLVCDKCSKPSLFKAFKCEKCGLVYEGNSVRGDFVDRCPNQDCGYSAIEQGRKDAAGGGS